MKKILAVIIACLALSTTAMAAPGAVIDDSASSKVENSDAKATKGKAPIEDSASAIVEVVKPVKPAAKTRKSAATKPATQKTVSKPARKTSTQTSAVTTRTTGATVVWADDPKPQRTPVQTVKAVEKKNETQKIDIVPPKEIKTSDMTFAYALSGLFGVSGIGTVLKRRARRILASR